MPPRPTALAARLRTLAARAARAARSRWARVVLTVVIGLAGGYVGLLVGGRTVTPVGPANVQLVLHPSLHGGTTLELPPLGAVRLDTHAGPVSVEAHLTDVRPDQVQRLIEDDSALDRLTDKIADQIRHGVTVLLIRAAVLALVFAFVAALVLFRSWRRALAALGSSAADVLALALLAWTTFDPQSAAEPRYTGLLANAPQVVGNAESVFTRFSHYRAQLARLVGNASKLYAATSSLPTYEPDPSTIRVLHVSDIHLNPTAWNVIKSVSAQFRADLVIDTGDLMDHGSKPEDRFAGSISDLTIPYVYIRGNHDSKSTQKAVARQKNAIVLDDRTREVQGLRVYGVGDPRFTPDKSTRDDLVGSDQVRAEGGVLADRLRRTGTTPDIVLTHDPAEGEAFSGLTPLVLSGHLHARQTRLLPTGTRLFVQGSTGGAGLRGLEHEQPTPIELSVLYFNRASHRLQGWDDLQLGGLGLTSAKIERHLEPDPDRAVKPQPPATALPASPSAPFPSRFPSDWPSRSPSPTPTREPG
ncbi:metallophosphoesterase family protein [Actinomadura opuntiae]|uniref:metallophosphoesterase family protein n=1 Tax=Actinomadura sp. OS1-43 TaxID=604315 RepID=UPI00255ABB94|nr:metallophosphoesterase [Actinomadura sp. OS1-43]MDL4815247.1 metallophosphoesterase [Actinomadura sp. OS1-43]